MESKLKKNTVGVIAGTLAGVCLILAILVLSIRCVCFDESFYAYEYTKDNIASSMGTSDEALMDATRALLEYTDGKRDSIMLDAEFSGVIEPFFNEREAAHMIDVKALYELAVTVMWICLSLAMTITVAQFIMLKKNALHGVIKGYLIANIIFAVAAVFIAVFVLVDFNTFWNAFHHVFFTNDLWQMNMFTDRMIQMFSGGNFFFDVCARVLAIWLGADVLILIPTLAFRSRMKSSVKSGS